jgi:bifunctional ADP-heptose synthase (sugar kinase/adenylyltransferase)
MLTTAIVDGILDALPHRSVGLLGDLFLDRYFDIDPALDEPSVETGLTAYQVTGVRSYPGALGTVLNNLVALGVGRIVPVTMIGDDGEGYELRQALAKFPAVDTSNVLVTTDRRTPTYAKPMRGGIELNRLDTKNRTPTPAALQDKILNAFSKAWPTVDAWVVLDQVSEAECGVVTAKLRHKLTVLAAADAGRFVLADSRERIHEFENVCVKPNDREAGNLVPGRAKAVFLTKGERGLRLTPPGLDVPAYPITGPTDICGAGDSCSAGITSAVAAGATFLEAAAFGNLIASITVQQIGTTGTAKPSQVRERWGEVIRT